MPLYEEYTRMYLLILLLIDIASFPIGSIMNSDAINILLVRNNNILLELSP